MAHPESRRPLYKVFQAIAAPRTNIANATIAESYIHPPTDRHGADSVSSDGGLRWRRRHRSRRPERRLLGRGWSRSVLARSKLFQQLHPLLALRLFHRIPLGHKLGDLGALRRGQLAQDVLSQLDLFRE